MVLLQVSSWELLVVMLDPSRIPKVKFMNPSNDIISYDPSETCKWIEGGLLSSDEWWVLPDGGFSLLSLWLITTSSFFKLS